MSLAKKIAFGDIEKFITRKFSVEGRRVVVIDGLFDRATVKETYEMLKMLSFDFKGSESFNSKLIRWRHDISAEEAQKSRVIHEVVESVYGAFPGDDIKIGSIYVNFSLYGEMYYGHTDDKNGFTAIYYGNREWEQSWHGETFFCNAEGEPLHVVAPRPGRVVIFDSSIHHRASAPSRDCFEPRINIAFKFVPRERKDRNPTKVAREKAVQRRLRVIKR